MNLNLLNLLKNINVNKIFSTTNKTLNIIKKSIPVYREIRPYATHEKRLFKNKELDNIKESQVIKEDKTTINDSLTFFN